jgi:hypothetical protein
LLSLPLLQIKALHPEAGFLFYAASVFVLGFLALLLFYQTSEQNIPAKEIGGLPFLIRFALFMSITMGLALHNSIAVLEGYWGRKTPFVRTPKFNLQNAGDRWQDKAYLSRHVNPLTWVELLLSFYFLYGLWLGHCLGDYGFYPLHLMLCFGFGVVAFLSIKHSA